MKILITGASGFIGSAVLKKMQAFYDKDDLIALSSKDNLGIKTIPANDYLFADEYFIQNGCEDIEILLHIGAFTPKSKMEANDISLTTKNIINTKNLLHAKLPNLKKLIYISTLDVYEQDTEIFTENSVTNPPTLYGWSKLYCEQIVKEYAQQKGMIYQILRVGHVYGEGEEKYKKVIPSMLRDAMAGKALTVYGDGEAIRTFIYIDDVVKGIVNAISLKESRIINLVGEKPITMNELAAMICKVAKKEVPINHINVDVKNVNYIFDNSNVKKYLIDEFVPFECGLKREYDYMEKMMR